MNKYLSSLMFLSHAMIVTQAVAVNPFTKLTPSIIKSAKAWSGEAVTTLSKEQGLIFLNLFALNSEKSIPAFMHCAEYVESQPAMLALYEELGLNIMQPIQKYAENVQEKIARKSNLTEQEEESLWQKLEIKVQELVAYINAIYYETLYSYLYTETESAPLCMFDENGIVPEEKRTKLLPQPE